MNYQACIGKSERRVDTVGPLRLRALATTLTVPAPSGRLLFVHMRQTIGVNGRVALIEEQDLVYREAPGSGAATPAAATIAGDATAEVIVDPPLLAGLCTTAEAKFNS